MAAQAQSIRWAEQSAGQKVIYSVPPSPSAHRRPPSSSMAATTSRIRDQQMSPMGYFPSPYHYYPFQPFFPPTPAGWPSQGGQYVSNPSLYQPNFGGYFAQGPPSTSTELVLASGGSPPPDSPQPSTSRSLIRIKPTRRDTPAEYPRPPLDDPENPPVPIHPYLYHIDCPVNWDLRKNLRHHAKRVGTGEILSSIALKGQAVNAEGSNHNTMKIICAETNYPWSFTITRENGITVADVFLEIANGLEVEVTDPERWIASPERVERAEGSRTANEGTGAKKTREAGDAMRRVDWLGTKTKFLGLVHSSCKEYESLVRKKVHAHARPNCWVLVVGEREDAMALVVAGGSDVAVVQEAA